MATAEPLTEREQQALGAQGRPRTTPAPQAHGARQGGRIFAGARCACGAGTEQHIGNVPAGASEWLGARVRWITAGVVDGSSIVWRCPCCGLAHRT